MGVAGWNAHRLTLRRLVTPHQIFVSAACTCAHPGPAVVCRKTRRLRRFRHTRHYFLTGNGNCLLKYTKEQAEHARLMLDVLIETVSRQPLTIFMVVAIGLVIMLARTRT